MPTGATGASVRLRDAPGFWLSSLRNRRQRPVLNCDTSTKGVLPISSKTAGRDGEGMGAGDEAQENMRDCKRD